MHADTPLPIWSFVLFPQFSGKNPPLLQLLNWKMDNLLLEKHSPYYLHLRLIFKSFEVEENKITSYHKD